MKKLLLNILIMTTIATAASAFEEDVIKTSKGDLKITFIGHGSLLFTFNGKNIYVDPASMVNDFNSLPKADLILVTHEHFDHLDSAIIKKLSAPTTQLILTQKCFDSFKNGTVMKNGDVKKIIDINIEAVPAYNLVHKNDKGDFFHPKGQGNGYVLTFGDKRVYIAGDTEDVPEMANLKKIDIAFLPMNLPYTMTPEMVQHAALLFNPKILYPYHTGKTETAKIVELLKDHKKIEVRIRKMP